MRLTDWELGYYGDQLTSNKGSTTIFDFLQGDVNGTKEQQAIYSFLADSYVTLPQIHGKDYFICTCYATKKDPK